MVRNSKEGYRWVFCWAWKSFGRRFPGSGMQKREEREMGRQKGRMEENKSSLVKLSPLRYFWIRTRVINQIGSKFQMALLPFAAFTSFHHLCLHTGLGMAPLPRCRPPLLWHAAETAPPQPAQQVRGRSLGQS